MCAHGRGVAPAGVEGESKRCCLGRPGRCGSRRSVVSEATRPRRRGRSGPRAQVINVARYDDRGAAVVSVRSVRDCGQVRRLYIGALQPACGTAANYCKRDRDSRQREELASQLIPDAASRIGTRPSGTSSRSATGDRRQATGDRRQVGGGRDPRWSGRRLLTTILTTIEPWTGPFASVRRRSVYRLTCGNGLP
jgi:hypothetical protein